VLIARFNTVDGFQGQEKDIIILSCVRSGPNLQTIGFLKDVRRMNVALTRAKSSLFIIGNGATLERSDERWRTIVQDAKQRGFYADVSVASQQRSGGFQLTPVWPGHILERQAGAGCQDGQEGEVVAGEARRSQREGGATTSGGDVLCSAAQTEERGRQEGR